MMNQSKKFMLFRPLILVILSKKLTMTQKLVKLKRKLLTMIIIISIFLLKELNKLTIEKIAARLKQVNYQLKLILTIS